jgi:hypothetical protein
MTWAAALARWSRLLRPKRRLAWWVVPAKVVAGSRFRWVCYPLGAFTSAVTAMVPAGPV